MNISEFNLKTFDEGNDYQMKPRIICNDGFSMSVQGSYSAYCSPRRTVDDYYSMEIGFPSESEPTIYEFMDGEVGVTNPTDTVYGYVPCWIIDEIIVKHGGINEELTFKNYNPC